ncbi:MAG: extracellular solute-binding protein [Proteobacteria bacterium]|nr:extracellular solute-binding protein [Pseudomonadota bacterium]
MANNKKITSKHLYYNLSRRNFIQGAAATGAVIVGAPAILKGLTRRAKAESGVVRFLMTAPTMIPGDWSAFEKDTGIRLEGEVMKDDPGLFLNEVLVNDAGDRFDLISTLSGAEQELINGEAIIPIEHGNLSNWAGMPDSIKQVPYLTRDLKPEGGTVWGTPLAMNADSFGYFPDKLNEPYPPEAVSWSLVFEDERTMGKSATGTMYYYLEECAMFLKGSGKVAINDPANMTPAEANATADYLIERKEAGQFRSFHTTFDDQVSLIKNGEVLAIRCWEPAVKEAQKSGMTDFVYANAIEGYMKWMHAAYIPTQVQDRGNFEEIYTFLNWLMSGAYAAAISPLRGYVSGRPDLGAEYAKSMGLGEDVGIAIAEAQDKLKTKFSHEQMWFTAVPEHLQDIQAATDRVLNA